MKKLLLALLIAGAAQAEEPQQVEVPGVKNPDMRSYRNVVAGLDAFQEYHALAPAVPELRFRLSAGRMSDQLTAGEPLSLRIAGEGDPIPVPVTADGTFTLPRVQSAIDDDADLILNRKKGALRGRPDIHTPGLPDNVRRLGDLRLECQVAVAIGKKEIGLLKTLAVNTLVLTTDWCGMSTVMKEKVKFWWPSRRIVEAAEIVDGERRETIETKDFSYLTPLADKAWSNDARIELRYAPEPTAEEKTNPWLQPLFVLGSMNDWTSRTPMRKLEDGIYTAELDLEKGKQQLKIGTRGLVDLELGAAEKDAQLTEGVATPLALKGKRLTLKLDQPGHYTLTLDARNTDAPTLRASHIQQ